jgi:hypothetical protein
MKFLIATILSLGILVISPGNIKGQASESDAPVATFSKCGTVITPAQVAKEQISPGTPSLTYAPSYCFGKTLSITVHVVLDSLGNANVTTGDILSSVAVLNQYFAPICMQFQVCQFNYIENYKYDRFLKDMDEAELLTIYYIPKTINIVYAKTVEVSPFNFVGGYAYLPGGPDLILLSKSSLESITHEMGHFFGLYHTFEDMFGIELVNGNNCATTGDLICDTPADPGGGNTPAPDCQMDPYTQDANSDWYVPQIGNVMSYYSNDCTCGFTTGQYNRMSARYLSSRFYLW